MVFLCRRIKKLTSEEKISVYQDYFHGRTDVYNKYYWCSKNNRFSWSVSCSNFWKKGCLIRQGIRRDNRCYNCPVSSFDKLTPDTLKHLFLGDRHNAFYGIGIFPLLDDNTCFFLAMDFDDDDWLQQLVTVYRTAVSLEFYPVMERSQSGHGGHLWFFFATNVKASEARKFGEILLEKAMSEDKSISFSSFDRMIPNQDYAPANGHGNCIALPLRADTYAKGNSAFINMEGQVIRQPIEYLLSRPKITIEELQVFLDENKTTDYFFDQNQLQMNLNTGIQYPVKLHVIIRGRIAIEKKGLNASTINVIRRCAAMWNPEYIKKKKEYKSVNYTTVPRVLHFDEEDENYIYIPGGLLEKLNSCLPETEIVTEEHYCEGADIPVSFTGKLHPKQEYAVNKMINRRRGILLAVPSFGKTVCAIWLIAYFHVNTLIIVDRTDLQDQWEDRIETFLAYPAPERKRDKFVRLFNGSKKKLGGKIDIATADSLISLDNRSQILSSYGLVIIDECHHASAPTYRTILSECTAGHIYGLTATTERSNGLEKVVYMYMGPVIYHETKKAARMEYQFRQMLVPRYTSVRMLKDRYTYQEMMDELEKSSARNWLIYRDIVKEYRASGKIIVLSERIHHIEIIADMLEKTCNDVYLLTGSVKKKERKEIIDHLRMLPADSRYILLATSSLLGEGFDLPSLKTLFLIMPITAASRVEQYTGRIHRNYEGKDVVKVYDYIDVEIPMAASMYRKRLIQYQKEGYFVQEAEKEIHVNQYYFEGTAGREILEKSLQSVTGEIVCFSTEPSAEFIQKEYRNLEQPLHRGIKVYVILPDSIVEPEAAGYLEGMGVHLKYSQHSLHCIIVDRRMVWISNREFLKDDDKETWYAREDNPQLADELLQTIAAKKEDVKEEGIFADYEQNSDDSETDHR